MKTAEQLAAEVDAWLDEVETVDLSQAELDNLLEYSTTIPTGKTIGKQWKRQIYFGKYRLSWARGEYVPDSVDPENYVGIAWHKINIVP